MLQITNDTEIPKVSTRKAAAALRASIKKEEESDDVDALALAPDPDTKSKVTAKPKIEKEKYFGDIKPKKEERVTIVIKQEGTADQVRCISPVEGPDGALNILDVSQMGLPPTLTLDAKYNRGFTRPVISKALGGGLQVTTMHWQGVSKRKPGCSPFLAFNREYNPHLSTTLGQHGILLGCSSEDAPGELSVYKDGSRVTEDLPLFVRRGNNDWVMTGSYNVSRTSALPGQYTHHLSAKCQETWVKGFIDKEWGKQWILNLNHRLAEEAALKGEEPEVIHGTEEGIRSALANGHISMSFTVIVCVGYREDWFERLLEAEEMLAREKDEKRIKEEEKKRIREEERIKEEANEEGLIRGEDTKEEHIGEDTKKIKKEGNAAQKPGKSKRKFKEEAVEDTRKSKRVKRKTGPTKDDSIEVYSDSDGTLSDGVEEAIII